MYSRISLLAVARVTKRKSARYSDFRLPKNLSVGALSQQFPFPLMLGTIPHRFNCC
jgi:hypothetical protein